MVTRLCRYAARLFEDSIESADLSITDMVIAVWRKIGLYLDSPDIDYTDWWMVHFRESPDCESVKMWKHCLQLEFNLLR